MKFVEKGKMGKKVKKYFSLDSVLSIMVDLSNEGVLVK